MNMNLEEKIKNFHFGASYRIKCENRESAYTKNGVTYKKTLSGQFCFDLAYKKFLREGGGGGVGDGVGCGGGDFLLLKKMNRV